METEYLDIPVSIGLAVYAVKDGKKYRGWVWQLRGWGMKPSEARIKYFDPTGFHTYVWVKLNHVRVLA